MVISREEMERRLKASNNLSRFSQSNGSSIDRGVSSSSAPVVQESPSAPEAQKNVRVANEHHKMPSSKVQYNPGVDEERRVVAGTFAKLGVPVKEIARDLGITPNQVESARTSKTLQTRVESNLERARDMALDKMIEALGLIDSDKLAGASLGELTNTAANLARIVEKTLPHERGKEDSVKLIIYSPEQKNMNDFKVIDV